MTNQNSKALNIFTEKFQNIKKYENSDIKLCLLINSIQIDSESSILNQQRDLKEDIDFFQEEKDSISFHETLTPVHIHTLKEELYNKLDKFTGDQEFSIPQEIGSRYTKRKRDFSRDRFYKEPKKYFIRLKEFYRFFLRLKRSKLGRLWLSLITGFLICLDLVHYLQ